MLIKVNRKELAKHIQIVQKAISQRTTMQILEGIKISAKENTLILTATDTEISIETRLSAIVEREGDFVINSRLFGDIVRKLENDIIDINIENYNMNLKCGDSIFNLSTQKADEYPDLPRVEENTEIKISAKDIKNIVKKTTFAVSTDESRIVFTGVFMDIRRDYINFVALDGFRMAIQKLEKQTGIEESIIIPARSLNELVKIIEDDEDISINISRNNIVFKFGDTVFYSTLLSGEFFSYTALLRDEHSISTSVSRKEFQLAVERASLLAREDRANLIKLNVENSHIDIKSNSEIGDVFEKVKSSEHDNTLDIAFNSRYILDGVKILEAEEINLNFTDSVNPLIITETDDASYIYLVLPVRLAG
ncbi:DNA polymerase III subunit beta [Peptoniphilus sp. MSJ-1]|uniref:Beta sliding clamp n=1 Tax=Peptoniphilus ovalis TaxID=2841503 RepID=A0ABS6FEU6_9FIRM|nr:DNA polymerase III subunit beta [Peptoniphilus ovalis]MBU5668471.1 DNA polymerase III subunit beta [Peptoniphilus ovalis]